MAQYAAPQLEEAYRYLVGRFKFVPTQTFPYILYSSYQEFLQTNVSAVSEGTLGVTSTRGNLELTLPYLGDHRLFAEISAHEMAHQFTIQKVRFLADQAKAPGDPLNGMPLWFIEGLAEFYAKGGLDPEGEMMVRDLLVNPDLGRGYAFLDFWSPGPYGFLWIYKVGQARCQFLEDDVRRGLHPEGARQLAQARDAARAPPTASEFEGLLELLTGDEPAKIAARFEPGSRTAPTAPTSRPSRTTPSLEVLRERKGIVTALNSSPDGRVLLYRSIIAETGESQLILVDPRAPEDGMKVQGDGLPGYESLHPIFGRNFALTERPAGLRGRVHSRATSSTCRATSTPPRPSASPTRCARWGATRYLSNPSGLRKESPSRCASSWASAWRTGWAVTGSRRLLPAFSPDGKRLAFIGLSDAGTRDVYVLPLDQGADVTPQQLTHDVYAERQPRLGPGGASCTPRTPRATATTTSSG